jgi:glutamate-5-semialdehyde dehydrogenase
MKGRGLEPGGRDDDIAALMAGIGARPARPRRNWPSRPGRGKARGAGGRRRCAGSPRARRILAANARDLAAGRDKGLSAAMMDRLALDAARIAGHLPTGCARWRRRTIRWAR